MLAIWLWTWSVVGAVPPGCAAPPLVDPMLLQQLEREDTLASLSLDAVATRCFDPEGKRNEQAADCGSALALCEKSIDAVKTSTTHGVDGAILERLGRPYRGQRFTVDKRPGPAHSAPRGCRGRARGDLYVEAIARRELAQAHHQVGGQVLAYQRWLAAEVGRCVSIGVASSAPLALVDAGSGALPWVDGGSSFPSPSGPLRFKLPASEGPRAVEDAGTQATSYRVPAPPPLELPLLTPPAPTRLAGRLYLHLSMSSACRAEVLPGPMYGQNGDWLLVPQGAPRLEVRGPCGGVAEIYFGPEATPRFSEVFGRGQPVSFVFQAP